MGEQNNDHNTIKTTKNEGDSIIKDTYNNWLKLSELLT